jgi:hypothetical protein
MVSANEHHRNLSSGAYRRNVEEAEPRRASRVISADDATYRYGDDDALGAAMQQAYPNSPSLSNRVGGFFGGIGTGVSNWYQDTRFYKWRHPELANDDDPQNIDDVVNAAAQPAEAAQQTPAEQPPAPQSIEPGDEAEDTSEEEGSIRYESAEQIPNPGRNYEGFWELSDFDSAISNFGIYLPPKLDSMLRHRFRSLAFTSLVGTQRSDYRKFRDSAKVRFTGVLKPFQYEGKTIDPNETIEDFLDTADRLHTMIFEGALNAVRRRAGQQGYDVESYDQQEIKDIAGELDRAYLQASDVAVWAEKLSEREGYVGGKVSNKVKAKLRGVCFYEDPSQLKERILQAREYVLNTLAEVNDNHEDPGTNWKIMDFVNTMYRFLDGAISIEPLARSAYEKVESLIEDSPLNDAIQKLNKALKNPQAIKAGLFDKIDLGTRDIDPEQSLTDLIESAEIARGDALSLALNIVRERVVNRAGYHAESRIDDELRDYRGKLETVFEHAEDVAHWLADVEGRTGARNWTIKKVISRKLRAYGVNNAMNLLDQIQNTREQVLNTYDRVVGIRPEIVEEDAIYPDEDPWDVGPSNDVVDGELLTPGDEERLEFVSGLSDSQNNSEPIQAEVLPRDSIPDPFDPDYQAPEREPVVIDVTPSSDPVDIFEEIVRDVEQRQNDDRGNN